MVETGILEVQYFHVYDHDYNEAKAIVKRFKTATMEAGRDFTCEDITRKHPYVIKFFAQNLMDCWDNAIKTKRIEKTILIRFGDQIVIVSLPAEPFAETGLAASHFPLTIIATLGMGEVGYVGLPEHYCHGGGYETSPLPSKADRDVGVKMIETAVRVLD